MQLTLGGMSSSGNNGTFPITATPSSSTVKAYNPAGVSTDSGTSWAVVNPKVAFSSSLCALRVQVQVPSGYGSPPVASSSTAGPNAAWWSAIGQAAQALDMILPATSTWNFWMNCSAGTHRFRLDERNLDVESFGV
jgi:hypothetical protein